VPTHVALCYSCADLQMRCTFMFDELVLSYPQRAWQTGSPLARGGGGRCRCPRDRGAGRRPSSSALTDGLIAPGERANSECR